MILYTETHAHTLRHRLAHSHALVRTRTHTCHTIAAHTLQSGTVFFLQYACHTHAAIHKSIQTHYTNRCARKRPRAPSWTLSFSHSHSHTRSHTCQYYGQAFFKPLLTHSPLAVFGRQDDEEWFKTEMHDMFPYKATQFETQHLCFSLSLHQACIKERREGEKKRLRPRKKMSGNDSNPRAWFRKATVTERRSLYCIYMV